MIGTNFYFDPEASGLAVFLGPTETKLMELAWARGELTVKKALALWVEKPRPAYTTVMTVMKRLHDKGLLARTRLGRSFVYQATMTREAFLSDRIAKLQTCLGRFRQP
jgi:predicted transcriptional regulator